MSLLWTIKLIGVSSEIAFQLAKCMKYGTFNDLKLPGYPITENICVKSCTWVPGLSNGLSTRPVKLRSGQCGDWVKDYTPRLSPLIDSAKCYNFKQTQEKNVLLPYKVLVCFYQQWKLPYLAYIFMLYHLRSAIINEIPTYFKSTHSSNARKIIK